MRSSAEKEDNDAAEFTKVLGQTMYQHEEPHLIRPRQHLQAMAVETSQ